MKELAAFRLFVRPSIREPSWTSPTSVRVQILVTNVALRMSEVRKHVVDMEIDLEDVSLASCNGVPPQEEMAEQSGKHSSDKTVRETRKRTS